MDAHSGMYYMHILIIDCIVGAPIVVSFQLGYSMSWIFSIIWIISYLAIFTLVINLKPSNTDSTSASLSQHAIFWWIGCVGISTVFPFFLLYHFIPNQFDILFQLYILSTAIAILINLARFPQNTYHLQEIKQLV